jgi:hypothetical protein
MPASVTKRGALIGLSVFLALAVTISPKIPIYARIKPDALLRHESALVQLLKEQGWEPVGILPFTANGGYRAVRLTGGHCATEIRIAALPANGEATALADVIRNQDDSLFFVHRGEVSFSFPRYAYARDKLRSLFAALHLSPVRPGSVLAVAAPGECRLHETANWHRLAEGP